MPRILSEKDIELLSRMAPEFAGESCRGSGMPYKSLLPPLANHYAGSPEDFRERLERLTAEDLEYIVNLVFSGEESLHCIPPDYYLILEAEVSEKLGEEAARRLGGYYALSCE